MNQVGTGLTMTITWLGGGPTTIIGDIRIFSSTFNFLSRCLSAKSAVRGH